MLYCFKHFSKPNTNSNCINEGTSVIESEYSDLIKEKYGFDISDKVVNYKIKYCESFIPEERYLEKSERLEFADSLKLASNQAYR